MDHKFFFTSAPPGLGKSLLFVNLQLLAIMWPTFPLSQVLPSSSLQNLVLNTNNAGDEGAEVVARTVAGKWKSYAISAHMQRASIMRSVRQAGENGAEVEACSCASGGRRALCGLPLLHPFQRRTR